MRAKQKHKKEAKQRKASSRKRSREDFEEETSDQLRSVRLMSGRRNAACVSVTTFRAISAVG